MLFQEKLLKHWRQRAAASLSGDFLIICSKDKQNFNLVISG